MGSLFLFVLSYFKKLYADDLIIKHDFLFTSEFYTNIYDFQTSAKDYCSICNCMKGL